MAKIRRFSGRAQPARMKNPVPSSPPYHVFLTDSASAVYVDLYNKNKEAEARGDPTNAACTTFRMVQEAIKVIIPYNPIDRKYALTGPLANLFRLKKGRHRICWIASSEHRTIFIIFISETLRKEGDANDPYRILTKMVMTGELDPIFKKLGIRKPTVHPTVQ
jgi:mRNA-degrading endonuclease RelE of RelBE toxin-antitoxin system